MTQHVGKKWMNLSEIWNYFGDALSFPQTGTKVVASTSPEAAPNNEMKLLFIFRTCHWQTNEYFDHSVHFSNSYCTHILLLSNPTAFCALCILWQRTRAPHDISLHKHYPPRGRSTARSLLCKQQTTGRTVWPICASPIATLTLSSYCPGPGKVTAARAKVISCPQRDDLVRVARFCPAWGTVLERKSHADIMTLLYH